MENPIPPALSKLSPVRYFQLTGSNLFTLPFLFRNSPNGDKIPRSATKISNMILWRMDIIQNWRNFHVLCLSGRSPNVPCPSLSRTILPNRILLASALVASALWLPFQAHAGPTLDQSISNQLDLNCEVLTRWGPAAGSSPELNSICGVVGGSGAGGSRMMRRGTNTMRESSSITLRGASTPRGLQIAS